MGTLSQVHKRSHPGSGSGSAQEVSNVLDSNRNIWHAKTIQAGLSTQIIVQAQDAAGNMNTVGAIQTLTPTETRPLVRVSEVGTDGVLQVVPNAAFTIELAVTRLVFDYRRLPAAFSRGFRHIHAQRIPFDIMVVDYNHYAEFDHPDPTHDSTGGFEVAPRADQEILAEFTNTSITLEPPEVQVDEGNTINTRYLNCWLTSYSYTYDQSNYLITENATIWAETVIDELSAVPLPLDRADGLELFFNSSRESNAMATAFIGGRAGAARTVSAGG